MIQTRAELLAHIKAHPMPDSVPGKRTAFAKRLAAPEGGCVEIFGGIEGLCVIPERDGSNDNREGGGPDRVGALWLHGGGYVLGAPETHVAPAQYFANKSGLTVFLPRYRRAPEHVWPAPLVDVVTVIDALDRPLVLVGDSAGGHLVLNVALARPDVATALILFSPNTDRTGRSRTRALNTPSDLMNSDAGDRALFRMAMPDIAPDDPQASPILADLSGLPPTYLAASEGEVLLGDARLLAGALASAGVTHRYDEIAAAETGLHMFQNWPQALPAARQVLDRAAAFALSPN